MRFLLSLPLPLLLILISFVSFDSNPAFLGADKPQEPWSTHPRLIRSANNISIVSFDSHGTPLGSHNPEEPWSTHRRLIRSANNISFVSFDSQTVSPGSFHPQEPWTTNGRLIRSANDSNTVKRESGMKLANESMTNYDDYTLDQVEKELPMAEEDYQRLTKEVENAKIEYNEKKEAAAGPIAKYNQTKKEWERLDGIVKEKTKGLTELKEESTNARNSVTQANEIFLAINATLTKQEELETKIMVQDQAIRDLKNNTAKLKEAKAKFDLLDAEVKTQITIVGNLKTDKDTKEIERVKAQGIFDGYEAQFKRDQCATSDNVNCVKISGNMKAANDTLAKEQKKVGEAQMIYKEAAKALGERQEVLKKSTEEVATYNKYEKDPQTYINFEELKWNMLKKERDPQHPVEETRVQAKTAEEAFNKATERQIEADSKLQSYPPLDPADKQAANAAYGDYLDAKRIKEPLEDEMTKMNNHLKDLETRQDEAYARVGGLKSRKEALAVSQSGSPLNWILVAVGVIVVLIVIGMIAFYVMKRKMKKQKKDGTAAVPVDQGPPEVPPTGTETAPIPGGLEVEVNSLPGNTQQEKDIKEEIRKNIKPNTKVCVFDKEKVYTFKTTDGLLRRIFKGGKGSEIISSSRAEIHHNIDDPAQRWLILDSAKAMANSLISQFHIFPRTEQGRLTPEERLRRKEAQAAVNDENMKLYDDIKKHLKKEKDYLLNTKDGTKWSNTCLPIPDEEKIKQNIEKVRKREGSTGKCGTDAELLALAIDTLKKFRDRDEKQTFKLSEMMEIILKARDLFMKEPKLLEVIGEAFIVGDLHGQLDNLEDFLKMGGGVFIEGGPKSHFIFLGDYVDRGKYSTELMMVMCIAKILYPDKIHMLRGNHETFPINFRYGLHEDLKREFNEEEDGQMAWEFFNYMFREMPLAAVNKASRNLLLMHGGIAENMESLDEIRNLRSYWDTIVNRIASALTWADPNWVIKWFKEGRRGVASKSFGDKAAEDVCKKFDVQLIVRAHQMVYNGFEIFSQYVISIFSASHYDDLTQNRAAMLRNTNDHGLIALVIDSRPKGMAMATEKEICASFNTCHLTTNLNGNVNAVNEDPEASVTVCVKR